MTVNANMIPNLNYDARRLETLRILNIYNVYQEEQSTMVRMNKSYIAKEISILLHTIMNWSNPGLVYVSWDERRDTINFEYYFFFTFCHSLFKPLT